MLHAVLNKFWKQHPTKQQLYSHLLPISQTIQVRVLPWTCEYISVDQPAETCIHQLCVNTQCCREDLSVGMDGERELRESVLSTCFDDDEFLTNINR